MKSLIFSKADHPHSRSAGSGLKMAILMRFINVLRVMRFAPKPGGRIASKKNKCIRRLSFVRIVARGWMQMIIAQNRLGGVKNET